MDKKHDQNIHFGSGDIIKGNNITKTTVFGSSQIDFDELHSELNTLLRKGSVSQKLDDSDYHTIDEALTATEKKDAGAVKRALKALTKFAIEFAKQLSLKYLVSLLLEK